MLKHKNQRVKQSTFHIEDIYDGEHYRNLSANNRPLSAKYHNNISFVLNTDGVPIFKSSKTSIWPIYLMINELPYKEYSLRI